jgi:ketosteroid isomerase-like protein
MEIPTPHTMPHLPLPRSFALVALLAACSAPAGQHPSERERAAIADTLRTMLVRAYDLTAPGDRVARMMSLYPATGSVVSASAGRFSASRDSLERGIRAFWEYVGQNMREPQWTWDEMRVDVLNRDAAVVTARYHVPHRTPRGDQHTISGAMTEVFQRRDGRWVVVQEHLSDVPQDAPVDTAASGGTSSPEHHH